MSSKCKEHSTNKEGNNSHGFNYWTNNFPKVIVVIHKEIVTLIYDNELVSGIGDDIALTDFPQYVCKMRVTDGAYERAHKKLQVGLIAPCLEAQKEENVKKNRYKNIFAYDHSRVVLKTEEPSDSRYINANYIKGYSAKNRYIAAQGPTEHTVDDFWTMIWQEHCSTLAMLTNLVECGVNKCYPYWPDENTESSHAGIMIKCKSKDVFADFIIRSLSISKEGEERSLTHCQYTTWPDRGVPQYVTPLVEYLHMIRSMQTNDFPMLVHCSAGCGRTGSFIAVHYLCEEALKERKVNVFECVKRMREQRVNMVQTPEQYHFVHECILGVLLSARCIVKANQFREYYVSMMEIKNGASIRKLEQQFMNMRSMLQLSDKAESAHLPENLPKNRTNIVANDSSRVFLWSTVQGCNDYINAIYIPNYRQRYAYIITEMPQVHTIIDFCRLLQQEECRTIVMLNSGFTDTQDGKYWADPGESVVCGPFRLTVKTVSEDENCICRKMELHYSIGSEQDSVNLVDVEGVMEIRQYQLKSWQDTGPVPDSEFAILNVINRIQSWQHEAGNHPIIVHCRNGAERSGLYCLCSIAIDRINSDGTVAMPLMLNHLRSRRKQLVAYFAQYKFCHDVVERYISQMKHQSSLT